MTILYKLTLRAPSLIIWLNLLVHISFTTKLVSRLPVIWVQREYVATADTYFILSSVNIQARDQQ